MKLNKSKKGISLIVLVITIIVMIILATAIILSLNSSNISGKANEAKLSSDLANKKEAASVYLAEYEINAAKGKIDRSVTSADKYVKGELKKAGIDISDIAVTEEGEILVGIAAMFVNNNVPIGTEVGGYKLSNTTSYTTSGKENKLEDDGGTSSYYDEDPNPATIYRNEDITWKYMGLGEEGEALIVGNITANSPIMLLGGAGGYFDGPRELNEACNALYSSTMGTARSINLDDVTRILEYNGERASYMDDNYTYQPLTTEKTINELAKEIGVEVLDYPIEEGKEIGEYIPNYYEISKIGDASEYNSLNEDAKNLIFVDNYWLSTSFVGCDFSCPWATFGVYHVENGSVRGYGTIVSDPQWILWDHPIRPVVALNSSVEMTYENGVVTLK